MLQGKNIYKTYTDSPILKGIDIHIKEGEMVALIGPSGAGKSTLMHILGLIDKPTNGEVRIQNKRVDNLPNRKLNHIRNREIGFIFQFHHLLPEFTALENICLPAWIARRKNNEVQKQASDLLQLIGLSHRANHKPKELSGGEQQRIAVARSLINNPSIILADEPGGNLDMKNAQKLHDLFRTLNRTLRQTFLIVTHNEKIVAQCDRVLTIQDGTLH